MPVKNTLTVIPNIKIHPTKIITYNEYHWDTFKKSKDKKDYQNTTLIQVEKNGKIELQRVNLKFINSKRSTDGNLSKQSKKKLLLAVDYMLLLNSKSHKKKTISGSDMGKNIGFVTLTLPSIQKHTDKEIKEKCLNQFLIELTRFHGIRQYIWRAEYQKNGNIHFHLLINRFIFYYHLRDRWNRIIEKLGYVTEYSNNQKEFHSEGFKARPEIAEKWSIKAQYKAYLKGKNEDWKKPNSTDIHKLQLITNLKAYISKYVTKAEESIPNYPFATTVKRKDIGRVWSCSVIFQNIEGAKTEIDSEIENQLNHIKKHFPESIFQSDYFSIINIDFDMLQRMKLKALTDLFEDYINDKFSVNVQHYLL